MCLSTSHRHFNYALLAAESVTVLRVLSQTVLLPCFVFNVYGVDRTIKRRRYRVWQISSSLVHNEPTVVIKLLRSAKRQLLHLTISHCLIDTKNSALYVLQFYYLTFVTAIRNRHGVDRYDCISFSWRLIFPDLRCFARSDLRCVRYSTVRTPGLRINTVRSTEIVRVPCCVVLCKHREAFAIGPSPFQSILPNI